ncbi:MAG: hypothetical protein JEY94_01320 [Melioribacteraceae bacterium]|nr:hypothetical protein [Melioribacteraceae bacterium]
MKIVLIIISFIGLSLVILPSFAVFAKIINIDTANVIMLLGTIIWFSTSSFWMNKKS